MLGTLRVLLLEDVPSDAELETTILKRAGITCETRVVASERDFVDQLDRFKPDLILSDFSLPAFDGLSALRLARERRPDVPYIFVSGTIGEERAIDALKHGATDYVLKTNLARLPPAVMRAVRQAGEARRRLEQDEKMSRLNRVRAVQSGISSSIVRTRDRRQLFREICDAAVEHGHFRMAWVGLTVADTTSVIPVAHSGHDEGYLDEFMQSPDEGVGAQSVIGEAVKQRREVVVNEIDKEPRVALQKRALARGYGSMIALPLTSEDAVIGFWVIYAAEPGFFDIEETRLLSDVAADVSFALDYIAKQERLNELAYYDVLTGLSNRNLLHEHLRQALAHASRNDRLVAVVFIDLDRFKWVNDTFGHGGGDRLLKEIGARIASCTREGDIVSRHGGDEFVMVLPDQPSRESAIPVLQRVLETISEAVRIDDCEICVSCSIGAAFFPRDGGDAETLLRNADAAMYRAKELGPGRLRFYAYDADVISLRPASR
ncbi:MAG: diguanylate cyclase [Betaproteobacteria bacterium]|nr:diguanylate cyclase [Betaproteobacteria bacterium]